MFARRKMPSSIGLLLLAFHMMLCHQGTGVEGMASGSCRYNGLGCTDDRSCWQGSLTAASAGNGVGNSSGSGNGSDSGGGGQSEGGHNSTSSDAIPANCKCCSGYPFYPGGECRSDCSRNVSLYLLNLWTTMAVGKQGAGEHNNNVHQR